MDFRQWQQLELRLTAVEQAIAELRPKDPKPVNTSSDEDGSEDGLISEKLTRLESNGKVKFLPSGDEVRGGIATCGPCYEISHSLWDSCLVVGLPILSAYDSCIVALLLIMNIAAQMGFVHIVKDYMSEATLSSENLTQLLRFRVSIAHNIKYADMSTGRSLATQVCGLDEQLQWASTQFSAFDNLQNYAQTGQWLALLAVGCWLATTLREVFNIFGFITSLRGLPTGHETILGSDMRGDDERQDGKTVAFSQISQTRRNLLYIFVALPRLVIAVVLMDTGTRYLANTIALEDLIMNAVALAFILDLDELLESAFAPRRARYLLDELRVLHIPKLSLPGIGKLSSGTQERCKNSAKIGLLLAGMVATFHLLLAPLHSRVEAAINILCSGRTDFVYAVNPATGIIEATQSFSEVKQFSPLQRTVLRLANPELHEVNGWDLTNEKIALFKANTPPALERKDPYMEGASMTLLNFLDRTSNSGIAELAMELPCMDAAFSPQLMKARLNELTNYRISTCYELSQGHDLDLCAARNMSSLRALCPQTCGCDDPLDPAAAAYATTVFGCPKFCIVERSMSTELKVKPCEDLPPEDFAGNIFMKRFLSSMFDYITSKQELRRTEILQYTQELRRTFWNQVPGPNKTESLLLASVYFSEGKWMEDVANGVWNLGLNIPHPRGMRGCDFLNSWEFEMITGSNFCRVRGDSSPFKSLRSQCPVACKCRKGQDDCPGTCPVGF